MPSGTTSEEIEIRLSSLSLSFLQPSTHAQNSGEGFLLRERERERGRKREKERERFVASDRPLRCKEKIFFVPTVLDLTSFSPLLTRAKKEGKKIRQMNRAKRKLDSWKIRIRQVFLVI